MSVAKRKIEAPRRVPPWIIDQRPELWVRPSVFARVVNRSTASIYGWVKDGTIEEFGYEAYQDALGAWFIRISETEYLSVCRNKNHLKPAY